MTLGEQFVCMLHVLLRGTKARLSLRTTNCNYVTTTLPRILTRSRLEIYNGRALIGGGGVHATGAVIPGWHWIKGQVIQYVVRFVFGKAPFSICLCGVFPV